jgi:hypothetical protein
MESDFPREKMYEKSAPGHVVILPHPFIRKKRTSYSKIKRVFKRVVPSVVQVELCVLDSAGAHGRNRLGQSHRRRHHPGANVMFFKKYFRRKFGLFTRNKA